MLQKQGFFSTLFLYRTQVNYKNNIAQPFKTDFAMSTNGNMQKIASVALTGGNMRSTLGITPR